MSDTGYGNAQPSDLAGGFNRNDFHILQRLARLRTSTIVQVVTVHAGAGPLDTITVDVQPLVKMLDGAGNATSHGTIMNVPVWRVQGGGNAIVVSPKVGSVGWMGVCDRDISSVQATGQEAAPGSLRLHDLADGIYFGGLFDGEEVVQSIVMNDDGITITDKNGNTIVCSSSGVTITPASGQPVTISGNADISGNAVISGSIEVEGTVPVKRFLTGSISFGGGAVGSLGVTNQVVSVPGARLGDFVILGPTVALNPLLTITGLVDTLDEVSIKIANPTAVTQPTNPITMNVMVIGTS